MASTTISSTKDSSTSCATATTCSNGRRCTAITTARRASRWSKALREGRDMLFDIDYQGTQQVLDKAALRRGDDLHPAALDEGAEGAPRTPRRGRARGHREAAGERAPTRSRAGRCTITSRQRRHSARASRSAGDPPCRAAEANAQRGRHYALRRKAAEANEARRALLSRLQRSGPRWRARRSLRRESPPHARSPRSARAQAAPARRIRQAASALCRSILRRWPKAACATRSSVSRLQGSGSARGMSSTIDEVTFGGGVNADGATSKRMRGVVRQPHRIARRP